MAAPPEPDGQTPPNGVAVFPPPRTEARAAPRRAEDRSLLQLTGRRVALVLVSLSALVILPILCVEVPSVSDYANHLARVEVLRNPGAFEGLYEKHWAVLPNLALDLVVGALATVMELDVAGKAFLALTLLQLALGTVLLHRQLFREWSLWPCASFAFLYSRTLLSGFVGYMFGVGLCLLAVTLWLRVRSRPPLQRLAIGVVLCTVLFFAHFVALMLYGLIVFAAEIAYLRKAHASGARAVPFSGLWATVLQGVPPLLMLAFLTPKGEGSGKIVYRSFLGRIEAFATPVYVYNPVLDVALALLFAGVVLWALKTRRLTGSREIVYALVAVVAVHLAMPDVVMTLQGGDRRLPIAAALLFFAGTRLDVRRSRRGKVVVLAIALIAVGRLAGVIREWRADQQVYADARAALAPVEPASRVCLGYPAGRMDSGIRRATAVYFVAVQETVRRGAFSPELFAIETQQPVRLAPGVQDLAGAFPPGDVWRSFVERDPGAYDPRAAAILARYDYVVLVDNEPFQLDPATGLVAVVDRPCAKLCRVLP